MLHPDPSTWSWWIWTLHGLGALFLMGFVTYWFRFAGLQASAQRGHAADVRRYNRALRGFPNSFYAKMLGKVPLSKELSGSKGDST